MDAVVLVFTGAAALPHPADWLDAVIPDAGLVLTQVPPPGETSGISSLSSLVIGDLALVVAQVQGSDGTAAVDALATAISAHPPSGLTRASAVPEFTVADGRAAASMVSYPVSVQLVTEHHALPPGTHPRLRGLPCVVVGKPH